MWTNFKSIGFEFSRRRKLEDKIEIYINLSPIFERENVYSYYHYTCQCYGVTFLKDISPFSVWLISSKSFFMLNKKGFYAKYVYACGIFKFVTH